MDELFEISQSVQIIQTKIENPKFPWMNGCYYSTSDHMLRIHREILDFYKWISPSESELHLRYLIIYRLQNTVSLLWPKAKVFCHGSTMTSSCLPSSDLDFVILYNSHADTSELLNILQDHLIKMNFFKQSEVINSAKCPIIKGIEKFYRFPIDISLNNENGVFNIQRNRAIISKYSCLLPLLMILKEFLYENSLDSPFHGGISSNTLIQILLFIIERAPPTKKNHLGFLLLSFFQFYGETFNYITVGISTRNDGFLFSRLAAKRMNWKFPLTLCVEDPQNPGSFLGENAFNCHIFREKCYQAFRSLTVKLKPDEESILARIITSPEKVTKEKARINYLYDGYVKGLFPNGQKPDENSLKKPQELASNNKRPFVN